MIRLSRMTRGNFANDVRDAHIHYSDSLFITYMAQSPPPCIIIITIYNNLILWYFTDDIYVYNNRMIGSAYMTKKRQLYYTHNKISQNNIRTCRLEFIFSYRFFLPERHLHPPTHTKSHPWTVVRSNKQTEEDVKTRRSSIDTSTFAWELPRGSLGAKVLYSYRISVFLYIRVTDTLHTCACNVLSVYLCACVCVFERTYLTRDIVIWLLHGHDKYSREHPLPGESFTSITIPFHGRADVETISFTGI